jgi:hypothetical protein
MPPIALEEMQVEEGNTELVLIVDSVKVVVVDNAKVVVMVKVASVVFRLLLLVGAY